MSTVEMNNSYNFDNDPNLSFSGINIGKEIIDGEIGSNTNLPMISSAERHLIEIGGDKKWWIDHKDKEENISTSNTNKTKDMNDSKDLDEILANIDIKPIRDDSLITSMKRHTPKYASPPNMSKFLNQVYYVVLLHFSTIFQI